LEEGTVYVTADLDGGKKKKKKKAFTTKKKNKHRHQPVKLQTLKYYSVDGSGKISYQRKVCPDCGAGFFMAKHYDRYYCGKCHTTLKLDPATIKANLAKLQ
jgi:small subunit ribosomal protein S27Ae